MANVGIMLNCEEQKALYNGSGSHHFAVRLRNMPDVSKIETYRKLMAPREEKLSEFFLSVIISWSRKVGMYQRAELKL